MPVYNAGEYLAPSVASILDQTHDLLELIIVNDGSTDGAVQELQRSTLPGKNHHLKILDHGHRGIVPALNAGLGVANFPFIARMDADDIAHPERLERQLEYLQVNPDIELCGTEVELFSETGELGQGYKYYEEWINGIRTPEMIEREIYIECPIPHPSLLMSRETWTLLGGYRESELPEDYDLCLRAHLAGLKFGKPEGKLLRWRDHPQRLSRNDPRYGKRAFISAKATYFSKYREERQNSRTGNWQLGIWGAGPTGKMLFDALEDHGVDVSRFYDIAPGKIGNTVRGRPVRDGNAISVEDGLILVAVSARGARADIRRHLAAAGLVEQRDFICFA